MKRLMLLWLGLSVWLSIYAGTGNTEEIGVGDPVPVFSVVSQYGDTLNTADLNHTVSAIVFFHTHCYDCRKELPLIQNIHSMYGKQVKLICISRAQPAEEIADYWSENGLTMPYAAQSDKRIFKMFADKTIPRIYIVGSDGLIKYSFKEKVRKRKLERSIRSLLRTK